MVRVVAAASCVLAVAGFEDVIDVGGRGGNEIEISREKTRFHAEKTRLHAKKQ